MEGFGKKVVLIASLAILAVVAGGYLGIQFLIPESPSHETEISSTSEEGLSARFSSMGIVHDAEMQYGSSKVVSYLWDFGDGTTSTERNPVHTYEKPGTYRVNLTITREDGVKFTDTSQVIVG